MKAQHYLLIILTTISVASCGIKRKQADVAGQFKYIHSTGKLVDLSTGETYRPGLKRQAGTEVNGGIYEKDPNAGIKELRRLQNQPPPTADVKP